MSETIAGASPSPGKREQTKAANRQAILDAARVVFGELGYGATTVRDIIRQTGLASGTFYNYFKSKEEVFQAIMDDTAVRVRPLLQQARSGANTFEEFLYGMLRIFFSYTIEDNRNVSMMRSNPDLMRVRMDTPEVLAGFEELRTDIEAGIKRGVVPDVDVELLTASIIGIGFEVMEVLLKREAPDPDGAARFATDLIVGGIDRISARRS